jgi:hypothetical protein
MEKLTQDSETKANILNKQFSSVFNTNEDKSTIPDKGPSPHPTMGPIEITENGVFKLLSNLKVHKAAGPDLIPTQLLSKFFHLSLSGVIRLLIHNVYF